VVTILTTNLTFKNSTLWPHSVCMCFVFIWEQTAIISLYSINRLVFITEMGCIYCAVRTGSLNTTQVNVRVCSRDMAEAFILWSFISEYRVRSKVSPCEISGGQIWPGAGFSPSRYSRVNNITQILHMSLYVRFCSYQTVVKVLRYKSEGRWFDSRWCHWIFPLTHFFRSHYDPGIDSASNRNEYQEYFLWVKAVGA
jgi:hypothetical protein